MSEQKKTNTGDDTSACKQDDDKAKVELEKTEKETDKDEEKSDLTERETNELSESKDDDVSGDIKVTYKLRDINRRMVRAWTEELREYSNRIQISEGDIFHGGPSADALVSPANSFGFMDGGIDMAYSRHFGWQMQKRLQKVIQSEYDGEVLVGDAVIIPAYEGEECKYEDCNEGQAIKYLISAPTMRIPMDVSTTPNAYLAFRAVILAVKKHNKRTDVTPIRTVLCPGLGTAVGEMPKNRCAQQMRHAFEIFDLGHHQECIKPTSLFHALSDHEKMCFD